MAIGLSTNRNLSEKNLNLKTALQKLYAPGIEDDIELFSLSSTLESVVISGPEEDTETVKTQIFGLASEKLKLSTGTLINRTKFITKYFTYTNENKVYFDNFALTLGSSVDATKINFSDSGSIPSVSVTYPGRGYYFLSTDNTVYDAGNSIVIDDVTLVGEESGEESARASITFEKEADATGDTGYLTKYTPGSVKRYRVAKVSITNGGNGYILPEKLLIKLGNVKTGTSSVVTLQLMKQDGDAFAFTNPIVVSQQYYYTVKNASEDSFYLYDENESKYVFLDINSTDLELEDIDIRRFDGITIENFIPFKFAGSTIYLRGYFDPFSLGNSISGAINSLFSSLSFLNQRKEKAVQNTKRPTPTTSEENILGYTYNSFEGDDVVIWQRVVIRDQDFVLDTSDTEITGSALKTNVSNFRLTKTDKSEIPIPGLFIKVGNEYLRAFSTTDKPFLQGTQNPNSDGVLSAEGYASNAWYAYNTTISKLAQRINPNGKDGAFYFHKPTAPTVKIVSVKIGGAVGSVYSTPLFRLV